MTPVLRSLLAPNPSAMTLDGTRTFVVGRRHPAVIDPGPADPAHLAAIGAALAGATPAAILLTHAHDDHAAAAPALADRTGAPVMMGRGARHLPFAEARVSRWLADGDRVETDAGALAAVATPGHAPEHLCFLWTGAEAPPGGALFAGDHFMGGVDTTLVSPPEGDLGDYLRSLERVEALAPGVIHPAHGPDIVDPAAAVARYRAHRQERIEQVVRALRTAAAPARAEELLDAVYGAGLDPRLRAAAAGSLHAILHHLAAAGRVRRRGGDTYALAE